MSGLIDLSRLPPPDCVQPVSFQAELETLLVAYTLGMRTQLDDEHFPYPLVSDPAYQILSTVAYRLGLQRQQINEACQATMLAYAQGADLDQLGANFAVKRLVVQEADDSVNPALPEILESDTRFRQRIQQALEAWTTAGSRGSYEFYALSASPQVRDVFIDRPEFDRVESQGGRFCLATRYDARLSDPLPGDVAVTVLVEPDVEVAPVLEAVSLALDSELRIPLTDQPRIQSADILDYQVEALLYCYPGPSTAPILAAAETQLQNYVNQHFRLGHDIAVSGLHQAAHREGVQRVELNRAENIVVQPWQAARCTELTVRVEGRDV